MPVERPLNPMADVFVRYLLGSENNKDLLIDFVNAVFAHKGHDLVVELEIRNPFNLRELQENKESILDVKAKDGTGRRINVEIQIAHEPAYGARSLYYWARSYSEQLSEGQTYTELCPSICINLLDFVLFGELPGFHSCFQITERDKPEYILSDHLKIHFIELGKLDFESELELDDQLHAWCYYFKKEGTLTEDEMPVLLKENPVIEKAHRVYKDFTSDERLMLLAESREKWQRDMNTRLQHARQQGIEQGIEQGMDEKAVEDARKMLQEGLGTDLIARVTGLSVERIEQLRSADRR